MTCFVCRRELQTRLYVFLNRETEASGKAVVCVPCAISHGLDGVLVTRDSDRESARCWIAHLEDRRRRAGR